MDQLPDEILLDIFEFHTRRDKDMIEDMIKDNMENMDAWHALIHVCRRWRNIVMSSSCRLNLQLFCNERRPVKKLLDVWPAFPIVIWNSFHIYDLGVYKDNIITALKHPDRVCEIAFWDIPGYIMTVLAEAMDVPLPELTTLELQLDEDKRSLFLPDKLFGGSAPCLRSVDLDGVPFSAVHNLLLSAKDLIHLSLWGVPIYEYVSPQKIIGLLSSMTGLETMSLGLRHPRHYPRTEGQGPSPARRIVLPTLTYFRYQGASGYLEDLMGLLDAPLLKDVDIDNSDPCYDPYEVIYFANLPVDGDDL
jgi:hypothetical protein